MQCSDASQELHDEDFRIEGKASVVFFEVVQLFGKSLRVVQQLEGREIGGLSHALPFRFCCRDQTSHKTSRMTELYSTP